LSWRTTHSFCNTFGAPMTLPRITSPHTKGANRTQRVMLLVIAATVPGILTLSYFFGIGPLLNIVLACAFAVLFEAAILALRKRPVGFFLKDGSVLVKIGRAHV